MSAIIAALAVGLLAWGVIDDADWALVTAGVLLAFAVGLLA